MMSLFFYLLMMIPLMFMFNGWIFYQFMLMLILIIFIISYLNMYFVVLSYIFGIDYISFGFIVLSLIISCFMVFSSFVVDIFFFLFLNLLLCLSLLIFFCVLNMFVMYVFFEFSLVPLMIIILGWGFYPERLMSGIYLFFYTLFASLPLFVVILYLYVLYNSVFFDMNYGVSFSYIMHFSMMFAFMVKLPMFMFHFWLPSAHVQAPVFGSMILAGLLLKVGGYGIIRFMFLYEGMFLSYGYIWYSFSIFGSFLVGLICFVQGDLKCMIAYSSISHMGICLIGLLTMSSWGLMGSYFMMIGHGFCSSGLFCLANICYQRLLSRSFYINSGMINFMPNFSMIWLIFCCFNMSCPPSINFIGELMLMISMFCYWGYSLFYMFMISFLSACFSFFLFSFTQHGLYHNFYSVSLESISEFLLVIVHLIPLVFILFFMGFMF